MPPLVDSPPAPPLTRFHPPVHRDTAAVTKARAEGKQDESGQPWPGLAPCRLGPGSWEEGLHPLLHPHSDSKRARLLCLLEVGCGLTSPARRERFSTRSITTRLTPTLSPFSNTLSAALAPRGLPPPSVALAWPDPTSPHLATLRHAFAAAAVQCPAAGGQGGVAPCGAPPGGAGPRAAMGGPRARDVQAM